MNQNTCLPNVYATKKVNSEMDTNQLKNDDEKESPIEDFDNASDSSQTSEEEEEIKETNDYEKEKTPLRKKLESWLNKNMKIEMTDGRTLIGIFLCTDRDRNIILGSCSEYLKPDDDGIMEEPRLLGLAMVPGCHIISINIDQNQMPWNQRMNSLH